MAHGRGERVAEEELGDVEDVVEGLCAGGDLHESSEAADAEANEGAVSSGVERVKRARKLCVAGEGSDMSARCVVSNRGRGRRGRESRRNARGARRRLRERGVA
jgi:hypothetical protein